MTARMIRSWVFALFALAGSACAGVAGQGWQSEYSAGSVHPWQPGFPNGSAAPGFTSPQEQIGPRVIIPVSGGSPGLAIPLGGSVYLPVGGGGPVVGIPLGP